MYPGTSSTTTQELAKLCYREIKNSGKKYPVFAIQDNKCYTTEKADTFDDKGTSTECKCHQGGTNAMTVFKVVKDPGQPEFESLGCFADASKRALPDLVKYDGSGMTPTMCYDAVKKSGTSYVTFGVQAGVECYAAKRLVCHSTYGKSDKCESGRGGGWANSVYKIKGVKQEVPTSPNTEFEFVGCWNTKAHRKGVFPKMVKVDYSGFYTISAKVCAEIIKNHCDEDISKSALFGLGVSYYLLSIGKYYKVINIFYSMQGLNVGHL